MSNYYSYAKRLGETTFSKVYCMDDYYGKHQYAIAFNDGSVVPAKDVIFQNRNYIDITSKYITMECKTIDNVFSIVFYDYVNDMMKANYLHIIRFETEQQRDSMYEFIKTIRKNV
jgi:hypothetical protein